MLTAVDRLAAMYENGAQERMNSPTEPTEAPAGLQPEPQPQPQPQPQRTSAEAPASRGGRGASLVAALAIVLASLVGAGTIAAPAYAGTPAKGSGEGEAEPAKQETPAQPSVVAKAVTGEVPVYDEPGASKPSRVLANPTITDGELVFLVDQVDGDWLKVLLPVKPNGSTGWIRAEDVALVGARNLDPPEAAYLEETGIDGSLERALDGVDAVYVALDVDVLDLAEAAMFMPEPDGSSVDAIATTLHDVASRAPLAGIGVTGMLADERNVEVVSRLLRAAGL